MRHVVGLLAMSVVLSALSGCALLRGDPLVGEDSAWTSAPIAPDPDARAIADKDCAAHVPPGAEVLIQDQRGTDGALFLYRVGEIGVDYSCFVGREADGVLRWSSTTVGIPTQAGDLHPFEVPILRPMIEDATPVGTVVGGVPGGTASVVIELTDGTRIDASIADGRYVAWWPSDAWVATVTALAADGSVVATVDGEFVG